MEVVKKNVKSKNGIMEYLKSINVDSTNKHDEIELNNYILSVIMITTYYSNIKNNGNEYFIYLLIQDKKDNKIYGKYFLKKINNEKEAQNYYKELKNNVMSFSNDTIISLIES